MSRRLPCEPSSYKLRVDFLRASAMLVPLCLARWMPILTTAWSVPVVWIAVFSEIRGCAHIRGFPYDLRDCQPMWWAPLWFATVYLYRAILVQAGLIFQLEGDSGARTLLMAHAWGSMAYMSLLSWFSYVASHYTIPVPMIVRPWHRMNIVF